MSTDFNIDFLDHVALRVQDLEQAAHWYEQVLGLKRVQPEEWKPWPVFMLAGHSGIALFPKRATDTAKVDHFAFRVSRASFEQAQKHLQQLGIAFQFQDHLYFHSIYFEDPDQHTVELTTEIRPFTDDAAQ
jgi:catechol 2,3-dioxygenase-like lactoylglutathione lyase family enzyme